MKKQRIWFYLGILIVFLCIFSFHGINNVKAITKSPSDLWGRDSVIDTTYFKKQVSLSADKDTITLFSAGNSVFNEKVIRIEDNKVISQTQYNPGMKSDRLVKYTKAGPFIIWTENYDLFISDTRTGSAGKKVQDRVNDFKALVQQDDVFIYTATDTGISAFRSKDSGFEKTGTDYLLEKPLRLSANIDGQGKAHILAIAKRQDVNYLFKYISFEKEQWKDGSEYLDTNIDIKAEVTNPQVAYDGKAVFLFYEVGKRDKNGIVARTYIATAGTPLKFEQLTIDPNEYNENNFLNDLKCAAGQDGILKAVVSKRNGKYEASEGYNIIFLNIVNGKVKDYTPATIQKVWIGDLAFAENGTDYAITFLQRKDDNNYEVLYSNTNASYKHKANKVKMSDFLTGFGNVLPAFAVSVLVIASRIVIFVPALIWLLVVEFFEFRKFITNPGLTFNIAFGIFTIIKICTINLYYKTTSLAMMPDLLKFGVFKFAIILATTLLAYFLTKLCKRSSEDMSVNVEFLLYAMLDIVMLSLFYSPYMLF